MSQWNEIEKNVLFQVRQALKDEIANHPSFPEVIGDRRILRFYYGNFNNIEKTIAAYSKFLKWRIDNNVNDIRQSIIYGDCNSPMKFPFAKKIIDLSPQIVMTANALDKKGQPLVLETFQFSPKQFREVVNIEEYLIFLTYVLEYRSLILEQLSYEAEREFLRKNPDNTKPYGVLKKLCHIRDLKGLSLAHISADGRSLVAAALELGLPNYPELLGTGIMVNAPWIFNTIWLFVKNFLDESTIQKINLSSSDYMKVLTSNIDIDNIPKALGGNFSLYNENYVFDLSKSGCLYYPNNPLELKENEEINNNLSVPEEVNELETSSVAIEENSIEEVINTIIKESVEDHIVINSSEVEEDVKIISNASVTKIAIAALFSNWLTYVFLGINIFVISLLVTISVAFAYAYKHRHIKSK